MPTSFISFKTIFITFTRLWTKWRTRHNLNKQFSRLLGIVQHPAVSYSTTRPEKAIQWYSKHHIHYQGQSAILVVISSGFSLIIYNPEVLLPEHCPRLPSNYRRGRIKEEKELPKKEKKYNIYPIDKKFRNIKREKLKVLSHETKNLHFEIYISKQRY